MENIFRFLDDIYMSRDKWNKKILLLLIFFHMLSVRNHEEINHFPFLVNKFYNNKRFMGWTEVILD